MGPLQRGATVSRIVGSRGGGGVEAARSFLQRHLLDLYAELPLDPRGAAAFDDRRQGRGGRRSLARARFGLCRL